MKSVRSYKNVTCFILLLLLSIFLFTACKKNQHMEYVPSESIPSLQLEYIKGDTIESINIPRGTASWNYKNRGIEVDAPHPLDAVGSIPEIVKIEDSLEIKLEFSSLPTTYTVKCWAHEYIENNEAYENYYEDVEITNDTLTIPNDKAGYIYLVHALWPQGNAYYGFNVINSLYTDDDIDNNTDNEKNPENIAENKNNKNTEDITTPVLVQDLLIGGLNKGEWMYYDEFYNSGAVNFEGYEYDVYSNNSKIATAKGSLPMNWMTGDTLLGTEYEFDYYIIELYENDNMIDGFDIALKADWDLFPRLYNEDYSENALYTDLVKTYLIESGLENPETTVKQSIKVDLEGDGTDEFLIYADNMIEDNFSEVKKGDNSVLIFRKYQDGKAIDQVLDQYIITENPEYSSPYRLLFNVDTIADLDGDGTMEVIVKNWYYEGIGWSIYKLKDNKLELVASNGIGA
ncbi:MAG: hypothetical protein PHC56_12215 [Herbinix sp.]|nr:hypothetical protein [Herbinix sp.]